MTAQGSIVLTGDLILDEPEPDWYFELARPVLLAADLVVGHVEVPFTLRDAEGRANPNPGRDPQKMAALQRAGFHVATLAANHVYDQGAAGVGDTLAGLQRHGIATTGSGMNLEGARCPAIVERSGCRVGVLSFNCVGPKQTWAGPHKPGCAYVEVVTHYELDAASPGSPPSRILTFAVEDSLRAMQETIARSKAQVDMLVVALHKGLVHTPVRLAMYERPVAHAAVDAGADVVVSHHAHICRGVEVYRNRPIFHGLGNFVTVTRVLNLEGNPNPEMLEWARRRREMFGFEPDPSMPAYPFHAESRNAMLACCTFDSRRLTSAGFYPCWIERDGRPRPLLDRKTGAEVVDYIARITNGAGLEANFEWDEDRVVFWEAA